MTRKISMKTYWFYVSVEKIDKVEHVLYLRPKINFCPYFHNHCPVCVKLRQDFCT